LSVVFLLFSFSFLVKCCYCWKNAYHVSDLLGLIWVKKNEAELAKLDLLITQYLNTNLFLALAFQYQTVQ
jgi:hypothetical protein